MKDLDTMERFELKEYIKELEAELQSAIDVIAWYEKFYCSKYNLDVGQKARDWLKKHRGENDNT